MKYRNTKTQVVIETSCVISGGDWVALEQPKKEAAAKKPRKNGEKNG